MLYRFHIYHIILNHTQHILRFGIISGILKYLKFALKVKLHDDSFQVFEHYCSVFRADIQSLRRLENDFEHLMVFAHAKGTLSGTTSARHEFQDKCIEYEYFW